MKKVIFLSCALILLITSYSSNAQTAKKEAPVSTSNKIEVYYFHFSARCITCKTVESEAKADVQNLYNGEVRFQAINLDDDSSKAIAEKLKVSGQTLLIVKGDQQINLTNEGFMYAMSNPAKFKSIIKKKIDVLRN